MNSNSNVICDNDHSNGLQALQPIIQMRHLGTWHMQLHCSIFRHPEITWTSTYLSITFQCPQKLTKYFSEGSLISFGSVTNCYALCRYTARWVRFHRGKLRVNNINLSKLHLHRSTLSALSCVRTRRSRTRPFPAHARFLHALPLAI